MISAGPPENFNFCHDARFHPDALFHLLRRQPPPQRPASFSGHPMFGVNIFNYQLGLPGFGQVTDTLKEDPGALNPLYQIGDPRSGQLKKPSAMNRIDAGLYLSL
jgi:hypothetical protein